MDDKVGNPPNPWQAPMTTPDSHTDFRLLDHLPVGHAVAGEGGRLVAWNHQMAVWTGVPAAEAVGRDLAVVLPALAGTRAASGLRPGEQQAFPGVEVAALFRLGDPTLATRALQATAAGLPGGLTLFTIQAGGTDGAAARLDTLTDLMVDAFLVARPDGRILDCNGSAGLLFGRAFDDLRGLDLRQLLPPHRRHLFEQLLGSRAGDGFDRLESACLRGDGSSFPAELSARALAGSGGREILVLVRDLSVLKRLEAGMKKANEAMEGLSFMDPLTGLWNRRFLEAYQPRASERALRRLRLGEEGADLLVLRIDLDRFKEVNETHGHHVGDMVLQQTAAVLSATLRQADLVVRWDGDAFLAVAQDTDRSEAETIAERVRAAVARQLFQVDADLVFQRTASIGVAVFPFLKDQPQRFSLEDCVDLADQALEAARRSGRDGWVGLEPGPHLKPEDTRESLCHDLKGALAEGRLRARTLFEHSIWD